MHAQGTENGFNSSLHKRNPVELAAFFVDAGEEHEETTGRADDDGVDENREHLHQPLFDRVADFRGSSGVWCRTHTSFVGEKPALDPHDQAAAEHPAKDGTEIEGVGHDHADDFREFFDVEKNNDDTQEDVKPCHDRYEDGRNLTDLIHAAEEEHHRDHCQHNAEINRHTGMFPVAAVIFERRNNVVRLQAIEAVGEGDDQDRRENQTQPAHAHCFFNVVSRAALEDGAVAFLIDLRQRTFGKRRRAADDRHDPHPHQRTRTTSDQRRGNTGDVTGTDAGSRGDHQRLEG